MPHTILLTGGSGYLGQHVLTELLQSSPRSQIRVVDLRPAPFPSADIEADPRVEQYLEVDILDEEKLAPLFEGVDQVVHMASAISYSVKDRAWLESMNIWGTRIIASLALSHGVKRLVNISSMAALGYNDDPHAPVDESFRFDWKIARRQRKYYMLTKHLGDQEVALVQARGLNAVTIYPGLLFGPGNGVLAFKLIRAIRAGKIPFNLPGGINVVDVRDVARGIAAVVTGDIRNGKFLFTGRNLTYQELNSVIASQVNVSPPRRTLPRLLRSPLYGLLVPVEWLARKRLDMTAEILSSGFIYRYYDNGQAAASLGWKPRIPLPQTIADTLAWMEAHAIA